MLFSTKFYKDVTKNIVFNEFHYRLLVKLHTLLFHLDTLAISTLLTRWSDVKYFSSLLMIFPKELGNSVEAEKSNSSQER